jgi:hypothetical protein
MKKLIFLFLLFPMVSQAQLAKITTDSAAVRERPRMNADIVLYLQRGHVIEVSTLNGRAGELYVQSEFGYISKSDIEFGADLTLPTNATLIKPIYATGIKKDYVQELLKKSPEDLTQAELQYLIYAELNEYNSIKKDVRTIKNIHVAFAVVGGVSLIASIIALSN